MNKVIVISGPSGVGKTTIYKRLLNELKDNIEFSISATTRKPRENEKDGVDYYFISKEEFEKKIKNNEFVEWANVYGNYYGTLKSEIDRILKNKHCLLDIDVQGGLNVKKIFQNSFLIFIKPPSLESLKERLINRHLDNETEIEKRLAFAENEISKSKFYDFIVTNDDLEECYNTIKEKIKTII
ncbi:MAG: guanylate kinase [Brevinematales bacterium]|nr:guanylate kinase [Brevinematales bacterium]